jgi:PAS domain S-box-containing protein
MSRAALQPFVWLLSQMDHRERQARSSILNALLLVLVPAFLGLGLYARFVLEPTRGWQNPESILGLALSVVVLGAVFLNRGGHYLPAAVFAVLAVLAGVFLANHFTVSGQMEPAFSQSDTGLLSYLVLPMVLAAALLPVRLFAATVALCIIGVLLVPVWYPHVGWMQVVRGPLQFLVIVTVLVVSVTHYLTRQERHRIADLAMSEQRFRSLFEQSLDPIVISDPEGRMRELNEAATRVLGYVASDLVNGRVDSLFANAADAKALMERLDRDGYLFEMPVRVRTRSNVILDCVVTSWARRDSLGQVLEYQTFLRDVTEQLRAEEEGRLRGDLLELAFDPVFLIDPGGEIVYANQALSDLVGYERDQLVGMNIRRLNTPETLEEVPSRVGRLLREKKLEFEADWMTMQGERVVVEIRARTIESQGRTLFLSVGRDLTQRRRDEAELRLRGALLDLSNDTVLLHDLKGRLLYVNEAAARRFGVSREEMLRLSLQDITSPQDNAQFHDRLGKLLSSQSFSFESLDRTRDGRLVPVEVNAQLVEMDGQPLILSVSRDVTERKRAEEEVRRTEQRYRELFEQSMDSVAVFSADGVLLDANPAHMRLFGNTVADIGRRVVLDHYVDPAERDEFIRMLERDGVVLDQEIRLKKRNGVEMDCLRTSVATRDEAGRIVSIQTVTRDVTEQKRAAEELRRSEEKYRTLADNTIDVIWQMDRDLRFTYVNPSIERLTGFAVNEWVGSLLSDHVGEKDFAWIKRAVQERMKSGESNASFAGETTVWRKDGGSVPVEIYGAILLDDSGQPLLLQGVARDISQRLKSESELRDREQKYRDLFEHSMDAISLVSIDGTLLEANETCLAMYGWTADDIGKVNVQALYPDRARRDDMLKRLDAQGIVVNHEQVYRRADGMQFVGLLSAVARRDASGRMVALQSIVRDITEWKAAQQQLRESEARFRSLLENTGAGILVSRLNGEVLDCNEVVQTMLGRTREEMLATKVPDLYASREERDLVVAQFRRDGFLRSREVEFKHKDGHSVFVALTSAYAPFGGESVVMSELLDVSERRRAEMELRESRERLRMLTAYLEDARERERAGIARELHDQLGQALTALRLDLETVVGQQERGEVISPDKLAGMSRLLDDTAADVRRISSELRPGILDDIGLVAAIEWQLGQWAERTGLRYNLRVEADDAGLDRARSTALFRVLQELLTNVARHSGASTLDVSFTRDAGRVVLAVSDDGCGITGEQASDPGSLGLIGMRERLRPLGGDLEITGSPGHGTTARASLPLS